MRDRQFLLFTFARRIRVDRQRMHGTGQFARERRVYQAMALDPALPFKGSGHNIHSEMRLAARPVAGMPSMQMGFVLDLEALGDESFAQLVCDNLLSCHVAALNLSTA